MTIHCEIISQDRIVYQGDADLVNLPTVSGQLGILPNHSPLLTKLEYGIIRVRHDGNELIFTVAGGIVEVQPDQVTILADAAERLEEIDEQRAEAAKSRAQELLNRGIDQDRDQYMAIWAALRRSNLRLEAVRRYREGKELRKKGS
jgi:F-type H+-transporting ATPase subunit epsilon